jgi:hypothetical protein
MAFEPAFLKFFPALARLGLDETHTCYLFHFDLLNYVKIITAVF